MYWPAGLIRRATVAENYYNAMKSFANMKPGQSSEWYERNPEHGELVNTVMELRMSQ